MKWAQALDYICSHVCNKYTFLAGLYNVDVSLNSSLPEFMYQRECVALDNPVTITSAQHAGSKATKTLDDQAAEDDTADVELVDEFDPSGDEEIEETTDETAPILQRTLQGEIRSAANFLLGARSRFGSVI